MDRTLLTRGWICARFVCPATLFACGAGDGNRTRTVSLGTNLVRRNDCGRPRDVARGGRRLGPRLTVSGRQFGHVEGTARTHAWGRSAGEPVSAEADMVRYRPSGRRLRRPGSHPAGQGPPRAARRSRGWTRGPRPPVPLRHTRRPQGGPDPAVGNPALTARAVRASASGMVIARGRTAMIGS